MQTEVVVCIRLFEWFMTLIKTLCFNRQKVRLHVLSKGRMCYIRQTVIFIIRFIFVHNIGCTLLMYMIWCCFLQFYILFLFFTHFFFKKPWNIYRVALFILFTLSEKHWKKNGRSNNKNILNAPNTIKDMIFFLWKFDFSCVF